MGIGMNASSPETPNLNLPPPVGEQLPQPDSGADKAPEAGSSRSAEQAPSPAEKKTAAAGPAPAVPMPPMTDPGGATQSDVSSTSQQATAPLLDDTDLIEKEWVDKAKQIVERTRDDPHRQSEELTEVKADYMKKRYNKTIKVSK